jgi:hypothetical protein
MPDQYELWLHQPSGKLYAVRLTRNNAHCPPRLAGICGPLHPLTRSATEALATYRYQAGSFLQDLETKRDEFTVVQPAGADLPLSLPADRGGLEILL